MIKIGFKRDLIAVSNMPSEVMQVLEEITGSLEENYGEHRNVDEDSGGYVLIIEDTNDFRKLKNDMCFDLEDDAVPEFVNIIKTKGKKKYTNSFILCNNEFGISIIMPLAITPENIKQYIDE